MREILPLAISKFRYFSELKIYPNNPHFAKRKSLLEMTKGKLKLLAEHLLFCEIIVWLRLELAMLTLESICRVRNF